MKSSSDAPSSFRFFRSSFCNGLSVIRLALAVFPSEGAMFSASCGFSLTLNVRQELLQLHQLVFHPFTDFFLMERRRSHALHTAAHFLISLSSSAFARVVNSAPTRLIFETHWLVSSVFYLRNYRTAWYYLGSRVRCRCRITLRVFFSLCASRCLVGYFSPCYVLRWDE